jgi:hypothetical protein
MRSWFMVAATPPLAGSGPRERLFFTPWGQALEPLARASLQRAVAG